MKIDFIHEQKFHSSNLRIVFPIFLDHAQEVFLSAKIFSFRTKIYFHLF